MSRRRKVWLRWRIRFARVRCAWVGRHIWASGYDPESGRCWHLCRRCLDGWGAFTTAEGRYDAVFLHGAGVKP